MLYVIFMRNIFALRPWRRHSLVLAVAGCVYVLIGVSYILSESTPSRESTLRLALAWWSFDWWGLIWILAGVLAVLSARWPPASEKWGYTVMTGLATLWAGFYLVGIAFGAPSQAFSGVLVWGLLAFMWWAISGLRNPDDEGD